MAAAADEADLLGNFETARDVYKSVRDEFHAWKDKHVAQVWGRIAGPLDSAMDSVAMERFRIPRVAFEADLPPECCDAEYIYVEDYDADGNLIGRRQAIPITMGEAADVFAPHPRYQYCTPASRNLIARMIDNKDAPFVPFPEDPTFPRDAYLSTFKSFQWVDDQRDPDGKFFMPSRVTCLFFRRGSNPV
jgi:histone-lysine N-methyltransferase EZH2